MFNLVVAIIAIALSAALAVAVYFNTDFLADKRAEAATVQLANQANQIWGASALYYTDRGVWPASVADLVNNDYLSAAPVPPVLASGGLVSNAMASPSTWNMIHHSDGALAYLVLPDSLKDAYCVAANLSARGEPVKDIKAAVKTGKATVHDKQLVAGQGQGQALAFTKVQRQLPALPTQLNSDLVYQCVRMSPVSAKGSYFWMTPRFAETAATPAKCNAFNTYATSRGANAATCGGADSPTTVTGTQVQWTFGPGVWAGVSNIRKSVGGAVVATINGRSVSLGSMSGTVNTIPVDYNPHTGPDGVASPSEDPECTLPATMGFPGGPPCSIAKMTGNGRIAYTCLYPWLAAQTFKVADPAIPLGFVCGTCTQGTPGVSFSCNVVACS